MRPLLVPLAAIGVLTTLLELVRALLRLFRSSAEAVASGEIAETRARRGDLTGMTAAEDRALLARRRRRADLGGALLWGAALAVPPATPWAEPIFAGIGLAWIARHFLRHARG